MFAYCTSSRKQGGVVNNTFPIGYSFCMPVLGHSLVGVTPREAAGLLGLPLMRVNKAIEQGVITTLATPRRGRLLDEAAIAGLALIGDLDLGLSVLMKRRITAWVRDERPDRSPTMELALQRGLVVRYPREVAQRVQEAHDYLARRARWITSDRDIRGGLPVIAGTRIGVYGVAERVADGDTMATLEEDYPSISRKAFETALEFARLNPRRGRPASKPWDGAA